MDFNPRRLIANLLFLASLLMIIWSLISFPQESRTISFEQATFRSDFGNDMNAQLETFMKGYELSLTWSSKIQTGKFDSVELHFLPTSQSGDDREISENGQTGLDYLDQYLITLDGKLEMQGGEYSPVGKVSQLLQSERPIDFVWNIMVDHEGQIKGTVWLYLHVRSKDTGREDKQVLTAQLVEIEGVSFLGLDFLTVRLLGSLGLAIGFVLGFDWIFIRWWNRLKSGKLVGT